MSIQLGHCAIRSLSRRPALSRSVPTQCAQYLSVKGWRTNISQKPDSDEMQQSWSWTEKMWGNYICLEQVQLFGLINWLPAPIHNNIWCVHWWDLSKSGIQIWVKRHKWFNGFQSSTSRVRAGSVNPILWHKETIRRLAKNFFGSAAFYNSCFILLLLLCAGERTGLSLCRKYNYWTSSVYFT